MKNLYLLGWMICCISTPFITLAQDSPPLNQYIADKPLLFSPLPQKFECNVSELQKIYAGKIQDEYSLQLTNEIILTGKVIDRIQKSPRIVTVQFRLDNYNGAILTLTFLTQSNQSVKIIGRILHRQYGDILTITEEKNRYFFIKQSQKTFMVE